MTSSSSSSNNNNFTVPNSISDSSKLTNSFKNIPNKFSSNSPNDGSKFRNATNNNNNNKNNNSSINQLINATTTAAIVEETSFSTVNFTNITAQVGSIVEIPCTVHHLAEGMVSESLNHFSILSLIYGE
jgi:hypothetical protein